MSCSVKVLLCLDRNPFFLGLLQLKLGRKISFTCNIPMTTCNVETAILLSCTRQSFSLFILCDVKRNLISLMICVRNYNMMRYSCFDLFWCCYYSYFTPMGKRTSRFIGVVPAMVQFQTRLLDDKMDKDIPF